MALDGIPHGLSPSVSGKERLLLPGIGGPPKVPLALRVSTMRQGEMAMNCNAIGTGLTICTTDPVLPL